VFGCLVCLDYFVRLLCHFLVSLDGRLGGLRWIGCCWGEYLSIMAGVYGCMGVWVDIWDGDVELHLRSVSGGSSDCFVCLFVCLFVC